MYEFTHRLPHEPWREPSRNEEEYFARLELERRMRRARQRQSERSRKRQAELRKLHHDHCPECGSELEPVHVQEGEVRQCPSCRGVWMEERLFSRLTHPTSDERGYLSGLLRRLMLEWTLGDIPGREPHGPAPKSEEERS